MCNRERGEKKNESMTITIFDIYAYDEQVEMKHFDREFSVAAMVFVVLGERELRLACSASLDSCLPAGF